MNASELQRSTVSYEDGETTAIIDGVPYHFGRDPEHGWYVIADGEFEAFHSGRVAAATFRMYVETAMLIHEHRRREAAEPPFVLGRVQLDPADYLPV